MKKFITTTAFIFLAIHLLCAQNTSKMSYELYTKYNTVAGYQNKLQAQGQEMDGIITATVFVRCDVAATDLYFRSLGGVVEGKTKTVLRGKIDITKLDELSNKTFVYNIEEGNQMLEQYADTAHAYKNINTLLVYQGGGNLSTPYKGTNALVGIIDTGIDYKHADFRNADGTTRILEHWDLNCISDCTPPTGYTQGSLYNSQQINDALNNIGTNTITNDESGHGTCVASLAAGNGFSTPNREYAGVAPDAGIFTVDLTPNYYTNDIVAGIEYMIRRSNELNKPIAINVSFGSSFGPHDGSDVYSTMVDEMLENERGKAVVFAAGNDGWSFLHLRHTGTDATTERHTWFQPGTSGDIYFQMYAYTGQFENIQYKFDVDVLNAAGTYEKISVNTNYRNIDGNINTVGDTLRNAAGTMLGSMFVYTQQYNATTMHVTFSVRPDVAYRTAMWRFTTKGEGTIDIWNRDRNKMVVADGTIALAPMVANYQKPDNFMSIAGGFNCSKLGVTVGAFTNENRVDYQLNGYRDGIRGTRYGGSSYGGTRDARIKPEIMAPGHIVLGAYRTFAPPAAIVNGAYTALLTPSGTHRHAAGTSYAAPFVAGALAMYLETNPDATQTEIHNHITASAETDAQTTANVPNMDWGYGKLDVYELLLKGESTWRALSVDLVQFSADKDKATDKPKTNLTWTTAGEVNNEKFIIQHSTDGKEFITIDEILGNGTTNTAHTYATHHATPIIGKNYYRLQTIEFSGKIETSKVQTVTFGNEIRQQPIEVSIYPNPTNAQTRLNLNIQNCQQQAKVAIINIHGSVLYSAILANGQQQIEPNLSRGIYFVKIHDTFDETNQSIQKLVIQ